MEEVAQEVKSPFRLLREDKAFIMRDISFADFKRVMEERFGSGALVIFYEVGKGCGERSAKRLIQKYPRKDRLFKAFTKYKRSEKWGDIEVELDLGKGTGTIIVHNCFEAREYGLTRQPACHFIKGYLEGFLTQTYNKPLKVVEVRCRAKGDPYCQFQIEET